MNPQEEKRSIKRFTKSSKARRASAKVSTAREPVARIILGNVELN